MGLFTDKFTFTISDKEYQVVIHTNMVTKITATTLQDGEVLAQDVLDGNDRSFDDTLYMQFKLDDDRRVDIIAGWISLTKTAIAVRIDGKLIHESSPNSIILSPAEVWGVQQSDS